MVRLFIGAVCVALVAWIWSLAFYVFTDIPYATMSETRDDRAAAAALLEHFPKSGTYILPGRYAGDEVRKEMRANGPVATVYIKREGAPEASPVMIAIGWFNSIVIGLLIGAAMLMLNKYTVKYWSHVAICGTMGLAYTAYPRFADIIWSAFPPGYQLMMIFSDGVSFTLMVMVMAWFTRPKTV